VTSLPRGNWTVCFNVTINIYIYVYVTHITDGVTKHGTVLFAPMLFHDDP
jgi:hypothetical protein